MLEVQLDIFYRTCVHVCVCMLMYVYVCSRVTIIIIILLVGLYSPIGSALECEASVPRLIHSSGELKCALRRPTICSDPVDIMEWGGILFMSLRI